MHFKRFNGGLFLQHGEDLHSMVDDMHHETAPEESAITTGHAASIQLGSVGYSLKAND